MDLTEVLSCWNMFGLLSCSEGNLTVVCLQLVLLVATGEQQSMGMGVHILLLQFPCKDGYGCIQNAFNFTLLYIKLHRSVDMNSPKEELIIFTNSGTSLSNAHTVG